MAFLADAHQRGVLRQAGATYQFRCLELQRAWPPGHSWPHLARSYLQENGVGVTDVIPTRRAWPHDFSGRTRPAEAHATVAMTPATATIRNTKLGDGYAGGCAGHGWPGG